MNLRALTLRYLGWCPGVHSAARWIPDREYSNRRVFASSMIIFVAILGLSLSFYLVRVPQSYSWDIEFFDAAFDNVTGMYVIEKYAEFDGVYNLSIWVDSKVDKYMLIRVLYSGGSFPILLDEWRITELPYNTIWSGRYPTARGPTDWKIYSSSRDQNVHVRIQYISKYPVWLPP
jgi:hypothetical protein